MSLSRVGLVVLVVGTAIAGSYFSITNPLKLGEKTPTSAIANSLGVAKKQGNLLTAKSPLEITQESATKSSQAGFLANSGAVNLTSQITDTISNFLIERITEKNSDGPTIQNGESKIAVPGEDEIVKLINKEIGSLSRTKDSQENTYHPKVLNAKLAIVNDTSKSTQINYINNLIHIMKERSKATNKSDAQAMSDLLEKRNPGTARELAKMYGAIANEGAKLTTPQSWNTLHKQVLSYYFTAESIWQDIANYEQDPAQAVLAARELPTLQQAEVGIAELVWREMQKNNISFDELTI